MQEVLNHIKLSILGMLLIMGGLAFIAMLLG